MIKFFRLIRFSMLNRNQTKKYVLYALGEIILVVIGILIALQINNWNEQQKLDQEEQKLLSALNKEIKTNLSNLERSIQYNDTIIQKSETLLYEGLSNADHKFEVSDIFTAMGYNYNNIESSITDEILGTNSRALISNDSVLIQIRVLKQEYDNAEKTIFYVDEFWNFQVASFVTKSGLGIYWAGEFENIDEAYKIDFKPNKEFYSLLGIMNAYQRALLLSRTDLKKILEETLLVLDTNTIDHD